MNESSFCLPSGHARGVAPGPNALDAPGACDVRVRDVHDMRAASAARGDARLMHAAMCTPHVTRATCHTRPTRWAARAARALRHAFVALMLCGALPLACLAPAAHAERADKDKPLNIEADNMTYDDLKQVTVFTGHVVATKGTILLKADRVEVRQDPQGYQYATGIATGNTLAYFRQKREGVNEYVDGTAERVDYDGKRDLTTLTRRATVRRLQGLSTVLDQVHGSVITYDSPNDFYTAKAGKDVAGPGNRSGRVRATLAPRTGGAAPLHGAPVTLKPSGTLRGAPSQ